MRNKDGDVGAGMCVSGENGGINIMYVCKGGVKVQRINDGKTH